MSAQSCGWPALQWKQAPQPTGGKTTIGVPTARPFVSPPSCSTVPYISWPTRSGGRRNACVPAHIFRSEPQTPTSCTRTRTSPDPGTGTGPWPIANRFGASSIAYRPSVNLAPLLSEKPAVARAAESHHRSILALQRDFLQGFRFRTSTHLRMSRRRTSSADGGNDSARRSARPRPTRMPRRRPPGGRRPGRSRTGPR